MDWIVKWKSLNICSHSAPPTYSDGGQVARLHDYKSCLGQKFNGTDAAGHKWGRCHEQLVNRSAANTGPSGNLVDKHFVFLSWWCGSIVGILQPLTCDMLDVCHHAKLSLMTLFLPHLTPPEFPRSSTLFIQPASLSTCYSKTQWLTDGLRIRKAMD